MATYQDKRVERLMNELTRQREKHVPGKATAYYTGLIRDLSNLVYLVHPDHNTLERLIEQFETEDEEG